MTASYAELTQRITWGRTTSGGICEMGRHTAEHLNWTIYRLAVLHPGAVLHVFQGAYHTGFKPSAGTHDKDGVLDVYIQGLSWPDGERFLREHGWGAFWRFPPLFATEHYHIISLGCPGPVGYLIPGQIGDYYAHRDGLALHRPDPTWFPPDINATIFHYDDWMVVKKELTMNHEQRTKAILVNAALPSLVQAYNEMKQVSVSKVRVRAQIAVLGTLINGVRALANLLQS